MYHRHTESSHEKRSGFLRSYVYLFVILLIFFPILFHSTIPIFAHVEFRHIFDLYSIVTVNTAGNANNTIMIQATFLV